MTTTSLIPGIIPRIARSGYRSIGIGLVDLSTSAMKLYADWRVGAREDEARNYDDRVLLTFDDYGTAEQVEQLLRILYSERVRAAFFVQGDWAENFPHLILKIENAGHIIGDHTFSHPDLLRLTDDEIRAQIGRGVSSPWLRPPRGRYNDRVRRIALEMGRTIKYWSIDSDDWKGTSAADMSRKILKQLHPGAVILFHIHAEHTPELLPGLIQDIRRRGYEIAALGEPVWGHK